LRSAWRARRPDLVHIATEGPLGWSALRVARSEGIPVVSEFRTNFHAYSAHYGIGLLRPCVLGYLRQFHNRCATTMVPTRGLAADLQVLGFERLRVVARGVDSRRFDPVRRSVSLRASWGAGPADLVAISVGRIAPEKNLELLVEAYRRMTSIRPGMRLVIVGDGPARPRLEAALSGAIFVGRRTGEDLATHYASADLLLFPSLTETFGNVTLEAMASGLAVVAFDYGAAGSVVASAVHGWLAPYGDSRRFLGLVELAAGDPGRVRHCGREARQRAESMSWERIVGEVLAIHHEALHA
jgi:glycosyltransferase involved in cell wall biosynthesis